MSHLPRRMIRQIHGLKTELGGGDVVGQPMQKAGVYFIDREEHLFHGLSSILSQSCCRTPGTGRWCCRSDCSGMSDRKSPCDPYNPAAMSSNTRIAKLAPE